MNSPPQPTFSTGQGGKPNLIYDGFRYCLNAKKQETKYWQCVLNTSRSSYTCKGRIITKNDRISGTATHTHPRSQFYQKVIWSLNYETCRLLLVIMSWSPYEKCPLWEVSVYPSNTNLFVPGEKVLLKRNHGENPKMEAKWIDGPFFIDRKIGAVNCSVLHPDGKALLYSSQEVIYTYIIASYCLLW